VGNLRVWEPRRGKDGCKRSVAGKRIGASPGWTRAVGHLYQTQKRDREKEKKKIEDTLIVEKRTVRSVHRIGGPRYSEGETKRGGTGGKGQGSRKGKDSW